MGTNNSKQARFEKKYKDETMTRVMSKKFKKLLNEEISTTDYKIILNSEVFNLHREVVGRNEYVKHMVENYKNCEESTEIKCPRIRKETFLEILNYSYTGKISINEYNLEDLYHASEFLWETRVLEHCLSYIREDTTISNVVYKLNVVVKHDDKELIEKLVQFIQPQFEEFVADDDFLLCTPHTIGVLLENTNIRVYDEETVFKAYYRWINDNFEIRKAFTNDLFGRIRIRYMGLDAINEPKSYLNSEIHKVLKKTMLREESQQALLIPPQIDDNGDPNIRDLARNYWNGIYFLTRRNGLVHYCPEKKTLHKVATADIGADNPPRTVSVGGRVFFVSPNTTMMMCYDIVREEWKVPARMLEKQQSCDVFSHRGKVFLFSHARGGMIERSLQVFSPETNSWCILPCFSYFKKHSGDIKAVSLGKKLLLYELNHSGKLTACTFEPNTLKAIPFNLSTKLPTGFYYHMIEYKKNLIFFAYLFASKETVLVHYNLKKQRYTVCKLREIFDELDEKKEQEMRDYLMNDLKVIRHREFVYFIESSEQLHADNRMLMECVNLNDMVTKQPCNSPLDVEKISVSEYYDILSMTSV